MKKQIRIEQEGRKQILKGLANDIRAMKAEIKKNYKELKSYMEFNGITSNDHNVIRLRPSHIRDGYYKILWRIAGLQGKLYEFRQKARCLHIIYCLYNGTPLEKIEPKHNVDRFEWDTSRYHNDIKAAQRFQEEYKKFLELKTMVV